MNILVVSAHDDTKSFVAAMHNTALSVLERTENKIVVSDLYAQGFNPLATMLDFTTSSGTHANYMFEQQRAVNIGNGFSPDIKSEMDKISEADLLIIHFPLWWGSVPAILKGWFERVFAMGFAWDSNNRYSNGLLKGKKALLVVSVGDPQSFYNTEGMHRATVNQHLYPITHRTLAFCGFDVLQPFIVHNVTAAGKTDLDEKIADYRSLLNNIETYDNYLYKHS